MLPFRHPDKVGVLGSPVKAHPRVLFASVPGAPPWRNGIPSRAHHVPPALMVLTHTHTRPFVLWFYMVSITSWHGSASTDGAHTHIHTHTHPKSNTTRMVESNDYNTASTFTFSRHEMVPGKCNLEIAFAGLRTEVQRKQSRGKARNTRLYRSAYILSAGTCSCMDHHEHDGR